MISCHDRKFGKSSTKVNFKMYTIAILKNQIQSTVHVVVERAYFTECSIMPAFLCHTSVLPKHGLCGVFF